MRAPMIVRVPAGALVVLIGPSGSGKSTFAARHFAPTEVLSSDAFRALVADDPNDQRATPDAFDLLHRVADRRLRRRRVTVVDATNVERSARRGLLAIAKSRRSPSVAIVLDVPLDVCLERNRRRGGQQVPEAALRRQQARAQRSVPGLADEGFDAVYRLAGSEAIDRSMVIREPAPPRAAGGMRPTQRNVPKEPRPLL
jgi:protein phosphatase